MALENQGNMSQTTMPEITDDDRKKRLKKVQQLPSSIVQLCLTYTNVFEGDVLALYGPAQSKNPKSPVKAQLMLADLVDRDGQLTITVNIKNNLISRFIDHFTPGTSVRISDFARKNKGLYDRGDAIYSLLLQEQSSVETILQVCQQRRLLPDTTISALLNSPQVYSVGSIAAIVIGFQQNNRSYELNIKDGDTINDTAILLLNKGYKNIFSQIQEKLASGIKPAYLFKNVVRNGARGSQVLRFSTATFVDVLTDEIAKAHLLSSIQSTTQVQGVLKAKNVFTPPFRRLCNTCNQPMLHNSSHCAACTQTTFIYEHCLECILDTEEGPIECTLHMPQLQQCCPAVVATSYEDYSKSISLTVFHLRGLCIEAIYTLTVDNIITEIKNR